MVVPKRPYLKSVKERNGNVMVIIVVLFVGFIHKIECDREKIEFLESVRTHDNFFSLIAK